MIWARMLAYITATVDQELLSRNDYLAAENHILTAHIKCRLHFPTLRTPALAEIHHLLDRKALGEVAVAAKPDSVLGWYRKMLPRSSMDRRHRHMTHEQRCVRQGSLAYRTYGFQSAINENQTDAPEKKWQQLQVPRIRRGPLEQLHRTSNSTS